MLVRLETHSALQPVQVFCPSSGPRLARRSYESQSVVGSCGCLDECSATQCRRQKEKSATKGNAGKNGSCALWRKPEGSLRPGFFLGVSRCDGRSLERETLPGIFVA